MILKIQAELPLQGTWSLLTFIFFKAYIFDIMFMSTAVFRCLPSVLKDLLPLINR